MRRTLHLFRDTNSVNKRLYPEQHARQRRKLTENDRFLILELVLERPGIYIFERTKAKSIRNNGNGCKRSNHLSISPFMRIL